MRFYLAPLEGITGHVYRNAIEKYFPGVDRYFTPFIAPDQNVVLRTKEKRDVLPENNHVPELIPQVLTNDPEHFTRTVAVLREYGYKEVNLNFGCPSGTVASRKRGSGILADPDELDHFLERVFQENTDIKISVKTRIGKDDAEDAFELMEIYRRYPFSELIIHPRTQKDFYRGEPRIDLFEELLPGFAAMPKDKRVPLCYNGNLMTEGDYQRFTERFPEINTVMLGRGVIANPGLITQIKTGKTVDKETLCAFLDEVLEGYRNIFGEDRNALFRMKEMWIYLNHLFADNDRYLKKLKKTQSLTEYRSIVEGMFRSLELQPQGPPFWNLPQK